MSSAETQRGGREYQQILESENFLLKFAVAMEARRPHTHIPLSFYNVLVKELYLLYKHL